MRFKKQKNIFQEGLQESVLHPYVKSSYNFINEEYDDEVDVPTEEENSEGTPETPKPGVETGFSNLLIDAINGEWDTINLYNSIIATLSQEKDKKYDAIIAVLQDITNEENVHVGQLQKALELLSPNASSIKHGEEEAQEQISADDYDDIVTEGLLFEADDTIENDEQKSDDEEAADKDGENQDTQGDAEEKSPKEQLRILLTDKKVSLKDSITTEKLIISNSDDGSKNAIKDAIISNYTNDEVSPDQLEKFESAAKQVGQDINIGDVAKQYGIKTESLIEQIVDSKWSEDKIKLTLYALTTALFAGENEFMKVSQSLVDKVSDDKAEKVVEELKKLESFAE